MSLDFNTKILNFIYIFKLITKYTNIFTALKDLLTPKEKIELEQLNNTYIEKRNKLCPNLLQKEFERLTVELASIFFNNLAVFSLFEQKNNLKLIFAKVGLVT